MNWFATNLISAFLLPPFNLILAGAAGVMLLKKRPRLGRIVLTVTLALLYLLSTPIIGDTLMQQLEAPPLELSLLKEAQAIVVLGGGTYYRAPEYGNDTVGRLTLIRVRYAAWLHRRTGKPILVTGGAPVGTGSPEAVQMKRVLEEEFKVPVEWMEENSTTTRENAYKSFEILEKYGIRHIGIVTHAWHMPRAAREFKQAGFSVVPAATAYTTRYGTDLFAFLPAAAALQKSSLFFHEVIGMLWYRLMPSPA